MAIVSLPFLILSLAALAGYHLLPRRWRNLWLLAASYGFLFTFGWSYALALAALTGFNYVLALRLPVQKAWLWPALGLNLASFGLLKFLSGPYGTVFANLLAPGLAPGWTAALLPVGFSFYILQAISYLVDVSRGQLQPETRLIHFALYLAYFPKLLAGPIERAKTFLPQLDSPRPLDSSGLGRGLGLILLGLLRKLVIADHLAALRPAGLFTQPADFSPLTRASWIIIFAFTLYNDFAGYTSMVRGLSAWFGIELSPNFRQPFFASTVTDFWKRWHISLSSWLRDYLFYPLQRWMLQNRIPRGLVNLLTPLMTMLASGFWHGAYLSMLLWGGLHGLYLALEQLLRLRPPVDSRWKLTAATLLTLTLTTLAWIPFTAASTASARFYLSGLWHLTGAIDLTLLPDFFLLTIFSLWLDRQEISSAREDFFMVWSPSAQAWGLGAALFLLVLFLGSAANLAGFVYQGF
jgi:D-alanyl-lipoteichoic acid acyltransferase DltB (MBOAT superfamily)